MRHEIRNADELPSVSIDVGFVEGSGVPVLGLDDVGQGDRSIRLDEVLESRVLFVVLRIELVFNLRKNGGPGDRGGRVGDLGLNRNLC